MSKLGKIYVILTIVAIISIVLLEYTKPKELNWFPSYSKHHKIPFGSLVFHEQLERIFIKDNITNVERPPYEYLNDNDTITGTYLFVNNNVQFDKAELKTLLDWTSKGNMLFIASDGFNEKLLDTINADNSVISNINNFDNLYELQLSNKELRKDSIYTFDKANLLNYFNDIDTLNTHIIGVIDNVKKKSNTRKKVRVNIIKHPFGEGTIILSTFPQAFTNYFMLVPPNQNYTAGLLSYIDSSKSIYVDNYYKSGKSFYSSPLYVLLNNKALKWAYYITLIGVFIYVIFEGKRKQRAIPIVRPLKNQTVDFTRTIANMYYENEKHIEIAQHKIQHFLEFVRTHLHLSTDAINNEFITNLAAKSNNTKDSTNYLINTIKNISGKTHINHKELETLNTLIETFKSNTK